MDILIKNMELPKDKLDYLHLVIQDGKVYTAVSCGHLSVDELVTEAVEIPPHGRLGELDYLFDWVKKMPFTSEYDRNRVLRLISETPTIVEASNGIDNQG